MAESFAWYRPQTVGQDQITLKSGLQVGWAAILDVSKQWEWMTDNGNMDVRAGVLLGFDKLTNSVASQFP